VLPIASGAERMKQSLGTAGSWKPNMSWATTRIGFVIIVSYALMEPECLTAQSRRVGAC